MVRRRKQESRRGPFVDFLEKHSDETLEFSDLRRIVAAFRDSIELIQKQNALVLFCVVEHYANVVAGTSEEAAHHCRQIERRERAAEFASDPLGGEGLTHTRQSSEKDGTRRVNPRSAETFETFLFVHDLPER